MPFSPFSARPWRRAGAIVDRRAVVEVPQEGSGSAAIFILLRRLRVPLLTLIAILTVGVTGLTLMPGVDFEGNPRNLTLFEALYFGTYTAATVGYTELFPYTVPQRMWVLGMIVVSVLGWAYAIGTFFAILGDPGFRDAVALERFRRIVRGIKEPFFIVAGFGNAGRLVAHGLDGFGRRFSVIDPDRTRIEVLETDQLSTDPPGYAGDLKNPAVLGMAGLASPRLAGVLALTDDEETNLAVLMTAHLLRPDVPVIVRASTRDGEAHMHDFGPDTVINPYDRFGGYLVLALERPVTFQLATWLLAAPGSPMPERRQGLADGTWVVCGDGSFATEIRSDLTRAGIHVEDELPTRGDPDVTDAVGFVAGTASDTLNLSLASHARLENPDLFVVVRQQAHTNAPLLEALDFDSVFSPTDLVAQEVLARVVTPMFWRFLDDLVQQDDDWSAALRARVVERCGQRSPRLARVGIDHEEAPGLVRWLRGGGSLTLGQLQLEPESGDQQLRFVPLMLVRDGDVHLTPPDDLELREGDTFLLAGRTTGLDLLEQVLQYAETAEFLATGQRVPEAWLWRKLTGYRAQVAAHRGRDRQPG